MISDLLNSCQKNSFGIRIALGQKKQNKFLKINKNLHTKHHNFDKKTLKFHDFEQNLETQNHRIWLFFYQNCDVWYGDFC